MFAPATVFDSYCDYCGSPIAKSYIIFSHRRQARVVHAAASLCGVCADRAEYFLRIALSERLLKSEAPEAVAGSVE